MLPLSVSGQQFIVGCRVASGEVTLPNLCATDDKLTGYHSYPASHEKATAAVRTTDQVLPAYSQTTPDVRARSFDTLVGELDLFDEDFFAITHQKTALSLVRLQRECTRTSNQLRMFAGMLRRSDAFGVHIDTVLPDHQSPPCPGLHQYLTVLDSTAMFGASDFPLAFLTAGGDTASVLTASCPAVARAHPGRMATAELTAQVIVRAVTASGLSVDVSNTVFDTDIGTGLVHHPTIQAMGLTGSPCGGKALWQLAQQHPQSIPVFVGISAINPLIILPQAVATQAEALANELVSSFTLGCGQFCIKLGLIPILRGEGIFRFMQALKVAADRAPTQIMLNTPAFAHYEEGVSTLEAHPYIQRLAGSDESVIGRAQARLYQVPTSLLLAQDPLLQWEVFGPLAVLVEVADEAELQSILRVTPGQLMVTVHAKSDDGPLARRPLPTLTEEAGHALLNGYPVGVEVCDAMTHDSPQPTTTGAHGTSVGMQSIDRFLRPTCLQNALAALFPPAVQDDNPLNLLHLINGQWTWEAISPSVG